MNPKVSVVMSVYNGESNVEKTINSVLNQTYTAFEFIIVNDCSIDKTSKILNEFSNIDNRIKILNNDQNLGLTISLRKGVEKSSGDYIARIDSGDLMRPERLQKQAKIFEDDMENQYGLIATDCLIYHIIDGEKSISKTLLPETTKEIRKKITFTNCIAHVSVMFRRNLYNKVGGYDSNLTTSQDTDLWIRMINKSDVYSLKEFLTEIIYDNSIPSISLHKNIEQRKNGIKIIKKAMREGTISKRQAMLSIFYKKAMLYTPVKLLNYLREKKRQIFRTV